MPVAVAIQATAVGAAVIQVQDLATRIVLGEVQQIMRIAAGTIQPQVEVHIHQVDHHGVGEVRLKRWQQILLQYSTQSHI